MTTELLLGVRLTPADKMLVIKLNDVDLTSKVKKLKTEVAGQINQPNDSFDLIYCGNLLENESALESYGLKSRSMIHVLKKKIEEVKPSISTSLSNLEKHIKMLTAIFKFNSNALLELARLTVKPELIEKIIASSPELREDPVAMAILQDTNLIIHFANIDTIKRIAKTHPALLGAAETIMSAACEKAHNLAVSSTPNNTFSQFYTPPTGHPYGLDNFSDDEEMAGDSSQSSDSTQPSNSVNPPRTPTNSTLNASRYLSAISRFRRTNGSASGSSGTVNNTNSTSSSPVSSTPRMLDSDGGDVITFEMVNQAMQQAILLNSVIQPPSPQNASPASDMEAHLSIMHEMGLQNDAINIQALQVTNGDVHAAIELVLSGFGDN